MKKILEWDNHFPGLGEIEGLRVDGESKKKVKNLRIKGNLV